MPEYPATILLVLCYPMGIIKHFCTTDRRLYHRKGT